MNAQVDVRNACVSYASISIFRDISFQLEPGEIGCLLGPSGCGKTSLLRAIAGFEKVSGGEIHLGDTLVANLKQQLAPEKRHVGMVFQDFALYPHLTVEQNVAFGLRKFSRQERMKRVNELLNLVGLAEHRSHYPHEISGGQQQRVALIRAMAPHPKVLLLDEPFSSMDTELRQALATEVRNILKRDGITALLVTHDQQEAFAMADNIGVLGQGKLQQWSSGYDLYHQPENRFVAGFIGQSSMLAGTVVDDNSVETALGVLTGLVTRDLPSGESVEVLIRPDDVIHDDDSDLQLKIVSKAFRGADFLYTLSVPGGETILCMVQSHHNHEVGELLGIQLDAEHLVTFRRARQPLGASREGVGVSNRGRRDA